MKKIIDGKTYNTGTAKVVSVWCNEKYGNMSYLEETLYKKKTGEYFLYGISGANGKYAESIGCNSWSGGAAFIPYTEDQAKEWLVSKSNNESFDMLSGNSIKSVIDLANTIMDLCKDY